MREWLDQSRNQTTVTFRGSLQMVAMLRKVFQELIPGAESKGSWDGG